MTVRSFLKAPIAEVKAMLGELIEEYKLLFIGMFYFLMFIGTLMEVLSCRALRDTPNGKENNGESWFGPVRTSYIVAIVTWLVSIYSTNLLLASTAKVIIILSIVSMMFSVMILMTTSILASAVTYRIMKKNEKLLPTQNGRQSIF
jgi:hypothetical protein